ncbi:amidohydrolase [uncultured Thiothrix sp.]|uniref:amidohydrolase n=1 Tax=uncultured Thiothrix sp. TaxID=223185 RepID=UPI0026295C8B|nr:amidohydrolase [uncultured Thiothrix sp.]
MPESLRVSLVQTELAWQNPEANRAHFAELLQDLAGQTDLIVLPEMFTTGFMMAPEIHAEAYGGATFTWLQTQAAKLQAAICGSVATAVEGQYTNRFMFATPDGQMQFYDKRHLFRMGDEVNHYSAGLERKTFNYQGFRILPQVCYDLRFPVFMRNRNDYDLAIVVANWPAVRRKPWRTLLQARAIENQSYVLGVNRVGMDGLGLAYSGDSLAIDFKGELLIDQAEGSAFVETTPLDLNALQQFREQFPAWMDADEFSLN